MRAGCGVSAGTADARLAGSGEAGSSAGGDCTLSGESHTS